jgi:hypothetical protein
MTALLTLLPALANAQMNADLRSKNARAASAAPAPTASAGINFSRHKITDFCTMALDEAEMKLLVLHRGYRIKTFKVSKTNCYEVYGFDKENRVVEAYFHPITTRLLLQNTAQ